ncbi:MAG: hypothetical protein EA367_03110 [Leptolyngbya sp. DLM2.Bin15]|nr:MAG: hypothetical protein EA367_03110 [Leptolyngbya sp. DLM2.Bin15]
MSKPNWNWSEWTADDSDRREVLGFLSLDIQDSLESLEQLLTATSEIEAGHLATWERSGNAYHLHLDAKGATLKNLVVDDQPLNYLSLSDFNTAVVAWKVQLESGNDDDPRQG